MKSILSILPWLEAEGIPITLFLNAKYLDGVSKREGYAEEPEYITHNDLEQINSPLVTIGMHGFEHVDHSTMTREQFTASMVDSRNVLEKLVEDGRLTKQQADSDPQKDSLTLMVISIAFGLVHILVGMGCKFVVCIREKDYAAAFFDTGLWMLLLVGLAVLAAGMFLAPVLVTVGAVIAIACAVGLVLTQGRGKKGIVGKAVGGLASLYDVTSYISDLLSYSRLLALGLTTGVMAQVFNMLSTMMGKSVVGFIFMIIIFIAGHLINIGLNALGSYVHTMRLQYVEMFSKFYEGGGKEFEPFSLQSKYIKIQEDNK